MYLLSRCVRGLPRGSLSIYLSVYLFSIYLSVMGAVFGMLRKWRCPRGLRLVATICCRWFAFFGCRRSTSVRAELIFLKLGRVWESSTERCCLPRIMAQPPRSVTLLARSQARSDDAEAESFEEPLVAPAVHPFTGTFAASEHTVAFGSKAFQLMFPLHVVALALLNFLHCICATSGTAHGLPLTTYSFSLLALGLLGARIALHRWNCPARAQRFGATAWTISVACACTSNFIDYCLDPKALCKAAGDLYFFPLLSILFTLLNASHGMEFWHTASLAGLLLCDLIVVRAVCADSAPVNLAIVALVVTFGVCHFAQLLARHAFLRFEHIQTSRDRLTHDFQRLEHRIFGSSGPRLPPAVTPTESSATTSSAAPQRKASSAPEAPGGGHTALPAGQVLIEWPPPHATHPSSAGPSTAGPSTAADPLSASVPLSAPAPAPPLPPLSAFVPLTTLDNFQALLNARRSLTLALCDYRPNPLAPHPPLDP